MDFEIVSEIMAIEPIAEGTGIRQLTKLMQLYGGKNWKKKKGFATVRLLASSTRSPCGTREMTKVSTQPSILLQISPTILAC